VLPTLSLIAMTADARTFSLPKEGLPPGFHVVTGPEGVLWIMREGLTLPTDPKIWDGWTRGESASLLEGPGGRAPVYQVKPDGMGPAVLRAYRHGGLLGRLVEDRFLGIGRFLAELRASEHLRSRGVATPEVMALYFLRSAGGFFRAWILTRYLSGGINLRGWVDGGIPQGAEKREVLRLSARAVGSLHDAGCLHRDLNLGNLLMTRGEIHLLDLDGARLRGFLTRRERGRNLLRLYRSLAKEVAESEPLGLRDRVLFLRTYARGDEKLLRSLWEYLRVRWMAGRLRRSLSRRRR
jgi:tRNA A-37 threonylcarbamoyl transferase component Bud32